MRTQTIGRHAQGMAVVCTLVGVLLLAGCQTEDRFDQEFFQQWTEEWTGRPLSDYVEQRGLEPTTYYDIGPGRRVFVFERTGYVPQVTGDTRVVTAEPITCRRVIETDQVDGAGTGFNAYQIVSVSRSDMAC